MSDDQFLDEAWIDDNAARFVERVTRLSLRDYPLQKEMPTFVDPGHDDGLTQGDYEVIVTDPRWLQHLKQGQTWDTCSYETQAKMPPGREMVLIDATP
jgi:hypothetical protein